MIARLDSPAMPPDRRAAPSDEALLRDCARGDERAFHDLFHRHRNAIVAVVQRRLGARTLWVEDVVQEVFVQLVRRGRSFSGRSRFSTWLYGVALNVCRNHLRREQRHRLTAAIADPDRALAELPDTSLDPLESLERDEREALLRRAVERLTPVHRTVLRLRDWEDLSYDEIARALDVPVGTVRSRLHNARASLAAALADAMRSHDRGLS